MKLTSLVLRHYVRAKLGRAGIITTLSAAMMFTLAACGTPNPPIQPTATAQPTVVAAETATIALPTAASTEPADTPIEVTEIIPNAVATGTAGAMEMTITPTAAGQNATATPSPASQSGQTVEAVTEINGTLREWAIDLSQKEAPAGTIRFVVTNEGQFKHNLTITDSTGEIAATPDFVKADGPKIVEIDLEPGAYTIICDLPGHAARGQKTELVVK